MRDRPRPSTRAVNDKIRVVCLIGQLGRGGTESQLYLLLRHLDRSRFDCRVIVFNRSGWGEMNQAIERLGIDVDVVPARCRGVPRRMLYVYRALRRLRPDVVHSWTALDNPYAGFVGRLAGVPAHLGSLRTTLSSTIMREKSRLHRWLILNSSRLLVVNSETCVAELVEAGIARERIRLLRNCVDSAGAGGAGAGGAGAGANRDVSELGIEPGHRLVGLVANLRRVKNHLFFIDAMARVVPDFPDLKVLLVGQLLPGESDLRGLIEERIASHALQDRFVLTGFRSDVPALMDRMEICCLASNSEGMPNVLLEAMAAGRPVVATRVGGVPELVDDGENGFLVELGDTRGFADAVCRLLREPELARRMGRKGRDRAARRHSCVEAAGELEVIYRDALADPGGRL